MSIDLVHLLMGLSIVLLTGFKVGRWDQARAEAHEQRLRDWNRKMDGK